MKVGVDEELEFNPWRKRKILQVTSDSLNMPIIPAYVFTSSIISVTYNPSPQNRVNLRAFN